MVSNHTLAPALQQRLQRAVAAFAEGRRDAGARELSAELPDNPVMAGSYRLSTGETVRISSDGDRVSVERHGIRYPAYRIGAGIRYVPGLDTYLSGAREGVVHWLNLYEDLVGERQ